MRIGELLLQQGLVTPEQLAAGLAAQHQFGGRVGSVLVELGYLNEDMLARVLSHQLGVPAALNKHFAAVDKKVVALFSPKLAESHNAIPLGFTSAKPPRLIVAFLDPVTTSKEEISFMTGARVDAGVAPQRQIARQLAKYYGVKAPAASRFVDVNFSSMGSMSSLPPPLPPAVAVEQAQPSAQQVAPAAARPATRKRTTPPRKQLTPPPPAPAPVVAPVVARPAPVVAQPVVAQPAPVVAQPAIRTLSAPPPPMFIDEPPPSLPMLAAEPPPNSFKQRSYDSHVESTPIAKASLVPVPDHYALDALPVDESSMMGSAPPVPVAVEVARRQSVYAELRAPLTCDEAKEILEAAATRDEIGDALSDYLRTACGCGLVLIVKDGMALGWKGFAAAVDASIIESISLPLNAPSIFKSVNDRREPFRGPPSVEGMPLQNRMWKLLRCTPPDEVVVVPVAFGKRVVNLVYAHGITGEPLPEATISELTEVCAFASTAYARIIRTKK